MRTLIVYYSLEGNTEFAARRVAESLGAELLRIEPIKAYPDSGFKKFFWGRTEFCRCQISLINIFLAFSLHFARSIKSEQSRLRNEERLFAYCFKFKSISLLSRHCKAECVAKLVKIIYDKGIPFFYRKFQKFLFVQEFSFVCKEFSKNRNGTCIFQTDFKADSADSVVEFASVRVGAHLLAETHLIQFVRRHIRDYSGLPRKCKSFDFVTKNKSCRFKSDFVLLAIAIKIIFRLKIFGNRLQSQCIILRVQDLRSLFFNKREFFVLVLQENRFCL